MSLVALWVSRPTLSSVREVVALPGFWASYRFTVMVAVASTLLAAIGGAVIGFAIARRQGTLTRFGIGLLNYNVGIAHLVWATALLALLSPSGWIARLATAMRLVDHPAQFPVLVNDPHGIGIIVHLVTKELPFVLLVTLPLASHRLHGELSQAATLGASPRSAFAHVYLPRLAPVIVPATIVVFAFAVGGYEPAAVLGVQRPRTLAVVAVDWFRDPSPQRRGEAFALTSIMTATVVLFAGVWIAATRRWWRRAGR